MNPQTLYIDPQPLTDTFAEWRSEHDEIAQDVCESLAALEAYQENLDNWHQQLVAERQELADEAQRMEEQREQLAAGSGDDTAETESLREQLAQSREEIGSLTSDLSSRSDELRALETERSDLATRLEASQAREENLIESLEREKKLLAEQEAKWSDELKRVNEMLERQSSPAREGRARDSSSDPVVGSVVAQFDKLRQQQALGRKARQQK